MMPPSGPLPLLTEVLQRGLHKPTQTAADSAAPVVRELDGGIAQPPVVASLAGSLKAALPAELQSQSQLSDAELDALAARLAQAMLPGLQQQLRTLLAQDPALRPRS